MIFEAVRPEILPRPAENRYGEVVGAIDHIIARSRERTFEEYSSMLFVKLVLTSRTYMIHHLTIDIADLALCDHLNILCFFGLN